MLKSNLLIFKHAKVLKLLITQEVKQVHYLGKYQNIIMGGNMKQFNTTFIIRSVGERTEPLCKQLILDQGVNEEDVFVVRKVPFSATMKASFKIGIEQGKKWTFCIDADVLLRPHSIKKMIQFAESQKENVCEVQGFVLDKFFAGPRQAGNHLYRTLLLPEVAKRIPEEGKDIRPETYTLSEMQKDGYPWVKYPKIIGIHDDEQYNFDIYRKAFVQAVKHLDSADLLITHWKNNIDNDPDYAVALQAFSDSIKNTKKVFINSEQNLYKEMFQQAGYREKGSIDLTYYSTERIEKKIKAWDVPELYYKHNSKSQGLESRAQAAKRRMISNIKERGIYRTSLMILGKFFIKLGKFLTKGNPKS